MSNTINNKQQWVQNQNKLFKLKQGDKIIVYSNTTGSRTRYDSFDSVYDSINKSSNLTNNYRIYIDRRR